jgi:hypothetical protein
MRTSLFALGFVAIGLVQCGNRDLFVADERAGNAGESGAPSENGGTGTTMGGSGGASNGGSENGGTENTGGSPERGGTGSGAEAGEGATGGTGGSDSGGTNAGGTDAGGTDAGGSAGSGTAARGGMNDGGRAGSANAGSGGVSDGGRAGDANAGRSGASGTGGASTTDCEALAREYAERLAAAQQCSRQLTVEQCTIEILDDFFCPCKTYVNPMNEADIRRLNEILEKRASCPRTCTAVVCPDVKRGGCAATNGSLDLGRCTAIP